MPAAAPGPGYPPPQANPYGGYAPAPPSAAYGAPIVGSLPYVEANFGPVATFGQRAGAYLIDAALTLIGLIPMIIGMFMMIGGAASASSEFNYETGAYETSGGSGALAGFGVLLMFVGGLVSFGIWLWNRVFKMGRTGQSVGKRVIGLKLINAETGQPIGAGPSFLREIVHSLANQIVYLSFLWMLWDANRQTLADLVVKSNDIVVPKS